MKLFLIAILMMIEPGTGWRGDRIASAADLGDPIARLDAMLKKYVDSKGNVDYHAWRAELEELRELVVEMGKHVPDKSSTRNEKMAYWINLYNSATVLLILDNYPLKSIRSLDRGKVWDRKWIRVGSETLSLNNIENAILRPRFKDARIHFAVNCAARSCPPLYNRAWTAFSLKNTLETRTRQFINNPKYNTITPNKVRISKIFDWYKGDFGDIIEFLNQYSTTKVNRGAKVTYSDYDWALNGK